MVSIESPIWLWMNCPGPSPLMTQPFVTFLPPNFYSAVEVLRRETAKLQICSRFAHSKRTERAFSSLPRQLTTQSLMNTHGLGNFMFPRKTCSLPFPVGRKSPCCALLKNPGSEQAWVAVCTAGSDCCCHLRRGPSCVCCYIWKNHWGKFFCKWTLQSWVSLTLSQFSLCQTLGGIQSYKWIQGKRDTCWWSGPLEAEPAETVCD